MTFSEVLNRYLKELDCTAKQLSQETGISLARISRYRNGITTPAAGADVVISMAKAFGKLAAQKKMSSMTESKIYDNLVSSLDEDFDHEAFRHKLNILIEVLGINLTRLAEYCNYNVSTISKVRLGKRITRDPRHMAGSIASYVAKNYKGKTDCRKVAEIMGKDESLCGTFEQYKEELYGWLMGRKEGRLTIESFLGQMDEFDMDEFLRAKRIGKIHIPTVPVELPRRMNYTGVKGMEDGIISFLKATVASKSSRDVILYTDHPLDHCMEDLEFVEQWIRGLVGLALKGIRINVIYNIDRPFEEIMLGLESWIPLYMTGLVNPYYMENVQSGYNHLMMVSGAASLCGDAINGYPESGRYFFSKVNTDVVENCVRAEQLLSIAKPIVEIYSSERSEELKKEIFKNAGHVKHIKSILTAPPIFTISDNLLMQILSHNDVSEEKAAEIKKYIRRYARGAKTFLKDGVCAQSAPEYTKAEMNMYPVPLALSGIFSEKDIHYTYEEYYEHMAETKKFEEKYSNYIFDGERKEIFRNVQINIFEGECVIASKGKAPVLHFVSKHPKIIEAASKMVEMITEVSVK